MNQHPNPDEFNRTVWKIVGQVPSGIVTTYGQIASMIPVPEEIDPDDYQKLAPRWVGQAMNAVSSLDNQKIPWWRVINTKGGISLPAETRAGIQQRNRLKREGVVFNEKELVDFSVVGWTGPDETWINEHGFLTPQPLVKDEPDNNDTPRQLSLF
jgi:methylated-DNA-protein-cysteine methyltransferase related protein